jgi:hypothetical protein
MSEFGTKRTCPTSRSTSAYWGKAPADVLECPLMTRSGHEANANPRDWSAASQVDSEQLGLPNELPVAG